MPKQLFFNISSEKRELFLAIAYEEFTTKSFEQVSVNSIIKKANISRGSFYTYFDNLESLFDYLFESIKKERFVYAERLIKESEGNFFEFVRKLIEYDYDVFKNEKKYSLFRNYLHYVQYIKKGSIKEMILKDIIADITHGKELDSLFNIKEYNLSLEEFSDLVEILMIIMVNTFWKSENEQLDKEETISLFKKRISYLEFGVTNSK